jgi:hypothetical protein
VPDARGALIGRDGSSGTSPLSRRYARIQSGRSRFPQSVGAARRQKLDGRRLGGTAIWASIDD